MSLSISPIQHDIYVILRSFLLAIMPGDVEVIAGQTNRVPEPKSPRFIMMNISRVERLETNIDTFQDCTFIGSIAGNILNVAAFAPGALPLAVGQPIWGVGVLPATLVTGTTQSVGGTGPFQINLTQTVTGSMASGGNRYELHSEFTIQCDIHCPDDTSADLANTFVTMFRDQFAVDFFNASGFDVWPIHCDDPRQVPFINAAQQYETRFIVEVHIQANQIITGVGQQAFDVVNINLIEIP